MAGGATSNITTRDSLGGTDSKLLVQGLGASNLPAINQTSLNTLSTSQGHDKSSSTFNATNNFPSASYYNSGITPNVTHVYGNLSLGVSPATTVTIYGIFVVEGNVTISKSSQVIGVIYCPNSSTVTINSPVATNSVTGGIVTKGTVTGSTASYVKHNMTYTTVFSNYLSGAENLIIPLTTGETTNAWTFKN
jgi:hypothetical protein